MISVIEHTRSHVPQWMRATKLMGVVGRSGMGAYHGKAGFDAFSHYRTVVGTDLPFSITGRAAPPFRGPTRVGTSVTLRMARSRTRRRLKSR